MYDVLYSIFFICFYASLILFAVFIVIKSLFFSIFCKICIDSGEADLDSFYEILKVLHLYK